MKRTPLTTIAAACILCSGAAATQAVELSGGITAITQTSNDNRIRTDYSSSIDFGITVKQGQGEWNFAFEGASSVRASAVAGTLGEANGDAGSAADKNDKGRVQLSELHYSFPTGAGQLTIGLMDVGAWLDGSNIANDETSQFLSAGLINNATIAFPDYTLGLSLSKEATDNSLGYSLVFASTHGLGDNTKKSYQQLIEVGESGKGIWLAGELVRKRGNLTIRGGAWLSTADNNRLDTGTANNYGIYTSIDGGDDSLKWNFRAGLANNKVQQGSEFLAYAVQVPWKSHTVGAGISWTGVSSVGKTATQDDTVQAELYLAWNVNKSLVITPSLQWIRNSGFDASGSSFDKNQAVFSVRMQLGF